LPFVVYTVGDFSYHEDRVMPGYPGKDGLNEQQKRFYREWLIDYNATQAAIRAGYSKKSAYAQGCALLKHPEGIIYLEQLQRELNEQLKVTREQVIEEMARIGMVDIRRIFTDGGNLKNPGALDTDTARAVKSVEVVTKTVGVGEDAELEHTHKIQFHDKMKALDGLAKHFNLYEDHQKSGVGEVNITIAGDEAKL
jgi:phage terminase small subunit